MSTRTSSHVHQRACCMSYTCGHIFIGVAVITNMHSHRCATQQHTIQWNNQAIGSIVMCTQLELNTWSVDDLFT